MAPDLIVGFLSLPSTAHKKYSISMAMLCDLSFPENASFISNYSKALPHSKQGKMHYLSDSTFNLHLSCPNLHHYLSQSCPILA